MIFGKLLEAANYLVISFILFLHCFPPFPTNEGNLYEMSTRVEVLELCVFNSPICAHKF